MLEAVQPGDIILLARYLLHLCQRGASMVDTLEEQGYWLVTVEELLILWRNSTAGRSAVPLRRKMTSILPHHGHNLAGESGRTSVVDRGVGVIFRQQPDIATLAGKALDCGCTEFVMATTISPWLQVCCWRTTTRLAGQNSGVQHAILPDPQRKVCVAEATGIKGQVILNTFLRQNGAAGGHISHNGEPFRQAFRLSPARQGRDASG